MNSRIKKNLKYNLFFLVVLFFLFSNINYVFALDINYPRLPGARPPQDFVGNVPSEEVLSHYINYIFNFIIWISGILAFGALVFAGIQYLISTGKPEKIISAKERMSAAFLGILLLLASFLILKTISPQFVILEIPKPEPIEIIKKPEIPLPSIEAIRTSIDTEMPIGRIIEKVFETYISDYPKPEEEKEPRMKRIKENAKNTLAHVTNLADQSANLKGYTDQCECGYTHPDPRCNHSGCDNCPPPDCTCDPCEPVRSQIQDEENKNLTEIASLVEEQRKTTEEILSLKTEIGRLERAESFIGECPFHTLTHFTQFLVKKDAFEAENLTLREIKFWDDGKPDEVNIVYNKKYNGEQKPEYEVATFYCAVSGTLEEKYPFEAFAPSEEAFTGEESEEEADRVVTEAMACSKEAPVGEITDRALRTGKLLVEKMEKLFEGGKKMIDAVDKLQILVSQCSSRRCTPACSCYCCVPGPFGCIAYCCAEIGCFGEACPKDDIRKQLEKINGIKEEINKLVNGKLEGETLEEKEENIGIITIIDEMVPEILKELESTIRYPMKHCASKEWEEQETILLNCLQAAGATTPEGKVINFCCNTYYWKGNEKQQTPFGDCFGECYLEKGQEKHRKCVQECLNRKGKELNDKDLPLCLHYLNFYCCHTKE